jgi:hypothetical protein
LEIPFPIEFDVILNVKFGNRTEHERTQNLN